MKKYLKDALLILFVCFFVSSCAEKTINGKDTIPQVEPYLFGLQVDVEGVVKLNGDQFKGVGVNYFNAFYRNLQNESDTTYKAGFRYLKSQHIPFVRFMACGFWPSDWELYNTNKTEYFARLDLLVRSAENIGIGLIPSLFWNNHTVPDLVLESVNQWGNTNSKTIAFMKKYTEEVVTRYKTSPAIWGWEFGNEVNLNIDLPGLNNLPPTWVNLGCPATRTEADKISNRDLIVSFEEFGKTIRKFDASRIIFSGNAIPRESAYHLNIDKTWDSDNLSEYSMVLGTQNPIPINSITIHLYPTELIRFADYPTASLKEIIRISMEEAIKKKKPLFIGEFGAPLSLGANERSVFTNMLESIEEYKVPLSALWVFDYSSQDLDWNVTPFNSRKYMLEEIGKLNVRLGIN